MRDNDANYLEDLFSWKRIQKERFCFAFLYVVSRNFTSKIFLWNGLLDRGRLNFEGNLFLKARARKQKVCKMSDCIKLYEIDHQATEIGFNSPKIIIAFSWQLQFISQESLILLANLMQGENARDLMKSWFKMNFLPVLVLFLFFLIPNVSPWYLIFGFSTKISMYGNITEKHFEFLR